MLRGLIICPDVDLKERLENVLNTIGIVSITKSLDQYPNTLKLVRMVRVHAPHVLFVSTELAANAFEIAREVERHTPGVQIIAISRLCDPKILLEAMQIGIREVASLPFDREALTEGLLRIKEAALDAAPGSGWTSHVFSFLPAKPGVGSSTIALNTSLALSRLPDTKVLLSDLDLSGGMIRFHLQLDNPYSVIDVAERSLDLDENMWRSMVTAVGSLEVLHAGKLNPNFQFEAARVRRLTEFLRTRYHALCFDMSGNLEAYSVETMHESKRIFLVCTPEQVVLNLAREKYRYLQQLDLAERVDLVVNRWNRRSPVSLQQIEEQVGVPVITTLGNDYEGVQKAIGTGRCVEPASELGKQFTVLAQTIMGHRATERVEPKKRFGDFFSMSKTRRLLAAD